MDRETSNRIREDYKQEIRSHWKDIILTMTQVAQRKVNGEPSYICPIPNCGHGAHGDGLTVNKASADGCSLKCFGCGWSGDIIDLMQKATGASYDTALRECGRVIGITDIPAYQPPQKNEPRSAKRNDDQAQPGTADYTDYYTICAARITEPDPTMYLMLRGISATTAAACGIGYDPASDPANAPGALTDECKLHPVARIIIPTTRSHYIGRCINDNDAMGERKKSDGSIEKYDYRKMNPNRNKGAGTAGIFNLKALYAQDVHDVFVTEGWANALSFMEAGAAAIATNSASNTRILLKALEDRPTKATLILAFDNDTAGRRATAEMREGLQRLNIPCIVAGADVIGRGDTVTDEDGKPGKEDANDLLRTNRNRFIEAVEETQRQNAARPDNVSYYIDNLMSGDIERFKSEIRTGFPELDKKSGGIYSGLYVIAAISSLGKTTFAAQVADQIAAAGNDVLFFSMEQSRLEMVSKSIARTTFKNDRQTTATSLSIRKGYLPPEVRAAAAQYKQEVQEHISVIEGNFNCDISFIGQYIRDYIRRTNARPVVMVDYLQVLQPSKQQDGRQQTTKETVDSAITELKRISRELELPVFVISSVNRANYLTPIDFESLKESGSIEYTADVLWGLQLQCLNNAAIFDKKDNIKERRAEVKKAKAATPRKIELVCLKNRYGIANFSCYFNYFPANDYFEESKAADTAYTPQTSMSRMKHTGR